MEEDIKILEERIELWRNDDRIMIQEDNFKILKAIEYILKRYKELEEENNNYKNFIKKLDELNSRDFIFRHQVTDKIDELLNLGNTVNLCSRTQGKTLQQAITEAKIQVLQELLEERNK